MDSLFHRSFVFCLFEFACYGDFADLNPIASFAEDEGLTLIMLIAGVFLMM